MYFYVLVALTRRFNVSRDEKPPRSSSSGPWLGPELSYCPLKSSGGINMTGFGTKAINYGLGIDLGGFPPGRVNLGNAGKMQRMLSI
jgi:hypothetical protein